MASAGGPRRGRLPDRRGGQRPAGRPERVRHEGLAANPEEDGGEVGHLTSGSVSYRFTPRKGAIFNHQAIIMNDFNLLSSRADLKLAFCC